MRLDKTRGGVLESKTFHGGNPSLRPDACCHHSMYRAFVLPAVVNRLPLRAHKEKNAVLSGSVSGSPGAWLHDLAYSEVLRLVPLTGTLGHLLSSPARRLGKAFGRPPIRCCGAARPRFAPNSPQRGSRRDKE